MVDAEFKLLVKAMRAVYAQPTFIPDQYAYRVWLKLLEDLEYKDCQRAIQEHMTTSKFPPTIADIRELAARHESEKEGEIRELEAWAIVRRAASNSVYSSVSEFEKLPRLIRRAVGSPENLCEWGKTEISQMETVIQSQFLRAYRVLKERDLQDRKLQPHMRIALDESRMKAIQDDDAGKEIRFREKCPPPRDLNEMIKEVRLKREKDDKEQ